MVRPFDCFEHCTDADGQRDDGARASRGCTHPYIPRVEWDPPEHRSSLHSIYLGRPPEVQSKDARPKRWQQPDWWKRPPEPTEDGCPAGYMISPFALSVQPYLRRRTEGGGRVPNPKFDGLSDRVAQAAVLELERHEERLIAHRYTEITKQAKKHGSRNP